MTKSKGQSAQAKRRKTEEEETIDKETGERIRHVRTEIARLDQKTFAARLGVTPPAVNQWEAGTGCNRFNLDRIAAEFDISQPWLNRGIGSPTASRVVTRIFMLDPDELRPIEEWVEFKWEKQQKEKQKQNQTRTKGRGGNPNEASEAENGD